MSFLRQCSKLAKQSFSQSFAHFHPRVFGEVRSSAKDVVPPSRNIWTKLSDPSHFHHAQVRYNISPVPYRRNLSSGTAKPEIADKTWISYLASVFPGVVLSASVMGAGFALADSAGKGVSALVGLQYPGQKANITFSGVPIAILLGVGINNAVAVPPSFRPGMKLCSTMALRLGIICLGLKLSAMEILELGAIGVPAVLASVGTGLVAVHVVARLLGISGKIPTLLAVGTSICGVTAITAIAPLVAATQAEVAVAVANVVVFGTLGMLLLPSLAHWLFPTPQQAGMFLGLAIHDTSQVMGAGLTYSEQYGEETALKAAAVTKLTRNTFLAFVIPLFAWMHNAKSNANLSLVSSLKQNIPLFVLGFIGMAMIRSLGDFSMTQSASDVRESKVFLVLEPSEWKTLTGVVGGTCSTYLLGTAMAAVGLNTSASVLRGVGPRPFIVGMLGAASVASVGALSTFLLHRPEYAATM